MGTSRSVIVICDENSLTRKSFYDACLLAQSASEGIDVIGNVPEGVQKVAESQGFQSTNRFSFLGENSSSPQGNYQLLNDYPLDSDLLVVAIGNSATLNMYISSRLELETRQILQWHIVSSNYARYVLTSRKILQCGFMS